MSYLKDTIDDVLILELDNSQTVRWYVDAAFPAVQLKLN